MLGEMGDCGFEGCVVLGLGDEDGGQFVDLVFESLLAHFLEDVELLYAELEGVFVALELSELGLQFVIFTVEYHNLSIENLRILFKLLIFQYHGHFRKLIHRLLNTVLFHAIFRIVFDTTYGDFLVKFFYFGIEAKNLCLLGSELGSEALVLGSDVVILGVWGIEGIASFGGLLFYLVEQVSTDFLHVDSIIITINNNN